MNAKIERIIKSFKNDTEYIIKENPSVCDIFRNEAIIEDGEVVNYNKELIGREKVRIFTTSQSSIYSKDASGNIIEITHQLLITKWDSIIQKGDILQDSNNRTFKVESIKDITYFGSEENNYYRKDGYVILTEES